MGSRGTEIDGQPTADSTPQDVAALYSWANLQGAKYRDYSASRREHRAQARYRAARALLERELTAQQEAEDRAAEAERVALDAEASAQSSNPADNPTARLQSVRRAEAASRKAAADRVEAARRAETAAYAAVQALREQREIAEAHSSAKRKAQVYEESEQRRRQLAGPQPHFQQSAGHAAPQILSAVAQPSVDRTPEIHQPTAASTSTNITPQADSTSADFFDLLAEDNPSPAKVETHVEYDPGPAGPAWLYASQTPPPARELQATSQTPATEPPPADTLLDFRERVASRWFALKDVFDHPGLQVPFTQHLSPTSARTQILAVFSLAGGVGKTSLVATLGRVFSSQGEKVVLADVTSQGLLPIYFGMREIRPGVMCTLPPLAGDSAPPLSLVSYNRPTQLDSGQPDALPGDILRDAQDHQRLFLDIPTGSTSLLRRIADLHPTVLVPLAPDMNSVISLMAVERLFRRIADSNGRTMQPVYILNQFDRTLPLHLDVREVLRRQLGDRLLRTVIRRSPAVSEALAEGMTVLEYAPDAPVSQDYLDAASWLRRLSPAASAEAGSALRSEP